MKFALIKLNKQKQITVSVHFFKYLFKSVYFITDTMTSTEKMNLLPSELRILEDFRRCKCDTVPSPSPVRFGAKYMIS